jgi:Cytotoxic
LDVLSSRKLDKLVPIPIPSTTFLEGLEFVGQPGGRRRYRGDKRIYEWDSLHGELEVYDPRGRHLGVADAESGELIKPAVRGRRIDV